MESKRSRGCARTAVLALTFAALLAGCASRPQRVPVSIEEIVQMSHAGTQPSDIIARMEASDTVYRLSGSELARLKEQGVPDQVLDYMQETYLDYERSRVYRYYDPWWGPPYPYWGWGYYGYYPYRPYYRHPHHSHPTHKSSKSRPAEASPAKPAQPFAGIGPRDSRSRGNRQQRN
jgi:hypothetical protein